jgi:hypothetical protein
MQAPPGKAEPDCGQLTGVLTVKHSPIKHGMGLVALLFEFQLHAFGIALLNLHQSKLPCPFVHITKNSLVNGLQMRQIKAALHRLLAQFAGAQK